MKKNSFCPYVASWFSQSSLGASIRIRTDATETRGRFRVWSPLTSQQSFPVSYISWIRARVTVSLACFLSPFLFSLVISRVSRLPSDGDSRSSATGSTCTAFFAIRKDSSMYGRTSFRCYENSTSFLLDWEIKILQHLMHNILFYSNIK